METKSMKKNILVYNNSTGIMDIMAPLLAGEAMGMIIASSLEEVIEILEREQLHMVLLDVELEGMGWGSGIELIRYIRRKSMLPLIVVSAQADEMVKIMALNAGADDYVTADSNPLVLLARIKGQLRRYAQLVSMRKKTEPVYRVGGLEVDDRNHTVTVDGRVVRLTPIEYKILLLLVQEQGKVLSISQIYESIWQMRAVGADNTIAVHVRHIREKIENNPKDPRYLKVVWGNGYKVG